ncbi:hypothetical protein CNX65_22745 [Actinosynnema pretiosum]|uniref:Uncharacterized protein n=1 Tax=Actinosynnema pretiosum TaxID=42197 RepID=A0A290Z9U5_9PSEU|nr:hypothetical protein CNX65_22745 [Actinosynnema pretiosum]
MREVLSGLAGRRAERNDGERAASPASSATAGVALARAATAVVDGLPRAGGARVTRVEVRETRSNTTVCEPVWS